MKSKLPRDILSLVNRKAHVAGIAYVEKEKKRLKTELETLRAEGMDLQELMKHLNRPGSI